MKTCVKCGNTKPFDENNFSIRKYINKHGETVLYGNICLECRKLKDKLKYQENKEKVLIKAAEYRENNRERIKEAMKEYNSRPEVKEKMKQYRQDNKEKIREKEKRWKENNPERYKQIAHKKAKVQNKRLVVRIRHHVSRYISFALNAEGSSKKGESVFKYLSYTAAELKEHLEKQFEPWMNWNNYGIYKGWDDNDESTWRWQIDHIIPQSELPFSSMEEDNFKKCWALENLRPYSAKQNILDGARKVRHENKNTTVSGE